MDEERTLSTEERRQRQKRLDRARRGQQQRDTLPPTVETELGAPVVEAAPVVDAAPVVEAPATKPRGRPKRPDITGADVQGLKYFEKLAA